ncbi:hypothetical protein B4099_0507 [Heyndrickxia coagulans]|uniref:Uncharacterized protein n=1 Tax=Heyndrickxia coagulans TaxID=1398 RepID=A0A150K3Y0_HEYCO|nr:hypothetical protein B4099_0507 [Heyndrickxia coagulans]
MAGPAVFFMAVFVNRAACRSLHLKRLAGNCCKRQVSTVFPCEAITKANLFPKTMIKLSQTCHERV